VTTNLCIGTTSFGLDYGISNKSGQVSQKEVKEILRCAYANNVNYIDTAQSYGNAEEVLGQSFDPSCDFKIVTKLYTQGSPSDFWDDSQCERWELDFQLSLKKLCKPSIYALLLHNPADLCRCDSHRLLTWMQSLIDRKLVQKIGISIYEASDLNDLPLEHLHLVQLPLSIYDQRLLLDGTVDNLHSLGKSVHARSIFLQGLVLLDTKKWPFYQSVGFLDHHKRWLQTLHQNNSNPVMAALGFIRKVNNLEAVLVGVNSASQFNEILSSWNSTIRLPNKITSAQWAWDDSRDLDPRCWPNR